MQTFAHIQNGIVREVLVLDDDQVLGEDLHTPEIAAACVRCGSNVVEGMAYDAGKKKFSQPPEPKPIVPARVAKAQAKIQLRRMPGSNAGKTLLDEAKAAIEAGGDELAIWFEDAQAWERQGPYVLELCGAIGLIEEQIDELFIAAAKIAA